MPPRTVIAPTPPIIADRAGQPTDGLALERVTFQPGFTAELKAVVHPGMTMMITDLAADPDTRSDRYREVFPLRRVASQPTGRVSA